MSNKYNAIVCEKTRYYKGVPYITKKDFNQKKNSIVVGKTKLKKYKSDCNNKNIDLLYFNDNVYEVKDKIFAFNKGYVCVGDNKYITLKKHIPFFFLFLFFLLFMIFVVWYNKNITSDINPITPPEIEVTPDSEKSNEEINKKQEIPNVYVPTKNKTEKAKGIKYFISFDPNEGVGTMETISCNGNELCKLPKNLIKKEGYDFIGWSLSKNNDEIYLDETEVFNLTTENNTNIILYAIWKIKSFDVQFINYDGSIIDKTKYNYGDKVIIPDNPKRLGYTFLQWDKDISEVKENLTFNALYNIENYEIFYELNGGIFNKDVHSTYTIEDNSFHIPSPVKKGYTFIGWTSDKLKEPKVDYTINQGTVGNLTLKANYKPNLYKLIYNTNGSKEKIVPKEIKFDDTYGKLPIVSKKGYTFINWTDKNNNEVSSKNVFDEENDITINANWNIINYNITYDLNDGVIIDNPLNYNVEENVVIPNPTKDGYTFIGWTTKNNDTPIVNYEIKKGTIGNLKLIANYRPNSYKIVYNSLSEGKTVDTQVNYDESVKLRKNTFIKEGYVFKGWSTVPEGSVTYTDEQEICNLSNKDKDVINLYAVWEVIKLNVKYYDLFGVILKEEQVAYGNSSTPPEDPFIDGYTFVGWNPTINTIKSNTDYHAEYIKNEYVVKYDLNKGNKNDIKKINYNVESDSFTLPQPTREGYTFVGWTGDNGFTPELQLTIPKGTVGNKNYKANWNANLYKVSLNPNEGTVNPNYIDISYKSLYGIIPTPERKGYLFDGWYNGDSLIKEDTVMNSAFDHEIKANWKIIDYSINYDLNGGSISSQPTSYNVESDSFTLPQPTREGYTFVGWTGDNGLIPTVNVVIEKGTIGDKNYKANWKVIDYSINYDLNGGSISSQPTSYNVESDSFTLPQPTKKGYTFVGWTGTELSSTSKNVTINKGSIGNRKYVANWSVNYYTVNYYVQNSLWTTRSVAYNTTPENLNAQSALDIYHKFNYWEGWVDKMPTNTVNLYANITESYCMLMTGHGPYGNAQALLNVFKSAGWTGRIEEAPSAPGYYWVVTDYTLTRAQADIQRNYIANHTNYTNYNFPYLYWVGLSCTNGIGDIWTRSVGTKNFTSQW